MIACHQYMLTSAISTEQIKKLLRNGSVEHEVSIVWIPRRTLVSNKILEDEGILGDVSIFEFSLYFLPLEDDFLSLELQESFTDLYLVRLPQICCIPKPTYFREKTRLRYYLLQKL